MRSAKTLNAPSDSPNGNKNQIPLEIGPVIEYTTKATPVCWNW